MIIEAFVTFHRRKGAQDWLSEACVIFTIGAFIALRSRNGTQERSSTTFTIENRPSAGGFSRGCVSVTIEGILGFVAFSSIKGAQERSSAAFDILDNGLSAGSSIGGWVRLTTIDGPIGFVALLST
jgi:hypothetical protein